MPTLLQLIVMTESKRITIAVEHPYIQHIKTFTFSIIYPLEFGQYSALSYNYRCIHFFLTFRNQLV